MFRFAAGRVFESELERRLVVMPDMLAASFIAGPERPLSLLGADMR